MIARLARNSLWNIGGGLVPAVVMLGTIPVVLARLGDTHYGLLALLTSIVGYFALVDLNFTAGTMKYVAEFNAAGQREAVHESITLGFLIYAAIGVLGALGIYGGADWLISRVFVVPEATREVAVRAMQWAALGFLFTQLQGFCMSVPQALERFDVSARLEMTFGVLTPVATVAILVLGGGIVEVIMLRAFMAAANCLWLVYAIRRLVPDFKWRAPGRALARRMLEFSGFAYLSRFAAMTYAHADSLIISALAGVGQLTLYSLPFTLTNRVLSITMRITQVVMPAVSALQARGEIERMRSPYLAYSRYAFYLNSFFGLLLGLFGAQILEVWLGAQYAETGGVVVLLIAAGMVVDSLTNMPSQVNDGLGRPKITGLFALARAVLGIGLGYFLTRSFGIVGAASAHLIASAIMTIAFLAYVHRGVFPGTSGEVLRHAYASVLVVAVLSVLMTFGVRSVHGASLAWTVVDAGLFATVYAVLGYMIVLAASDRNQIRMLVRSFFARPVPPT